MPYNHQSSYNSQKRKKFKEEEVKNKNTMTQKEVKLSPVNELKKTFQEDNQEITNDEKEATTKNKNENSNGLISFPSLNMIVHDQKNPDFIPIILKSRSMVNYQNKQKVLPKLELN
jgi:hypothetical protein